MVGEIITYCVFDVALVPPEVVSVALNQYSAGSKPWDVKLQVPLAPTLMVAIEPPLHDKFRVEPDAAVPVTVTLSLAFCEALDTTGALGAPVLLAPCGTMTANALDGALVAPADVVSVAVKS